MRINPRFDESKPIHLRTQGELISEFNRAKRAIPGAWRLMQDNAPCHTANAVKAVLREKGVQLIELPPYSPDLNPIENIWNWVKRKLETEYPSSV